MATDLMFQCSTFIDKNDNKPRYHGVPWSKMVESFMRHVERVDKDGKLWSPAVYKGNATRGNAGVETLSAAVGDFDSGVEFEDVAEGLAAYEYVAHSTHSHTREKPKFRIIIPFAKPVAARDWGDIKARIDEHVFKGLNDPGTKDPARIYYTPSCPPGALRFAHYHDDGQILNPHTLPASLQYVTIVDNTQAVGGEPGEMKVQLGKKALDFVANGAPDGEQRSRALATARNYLSAGYSLEETAKAVWSGLARSEQNVDKGPWVYDDALFIVQDLVKSEAPPLEGEDRSVPSRMELQRIGLGYRCVFPTDGISIKVDRVRRVSDGIRAELDIKASIPGVPVDLHWGSLNFSSISGRASLAKYLSKRTEPAILDWDSMLEQVCRKITTADREGEPFINLTGSRRNGARSEWVISGLLPKGQVTTIFGEGGGGKSMFCLAQGLSVSTGFCFVPGYTPLVRGPVLYLDYETDEDEVDARLAALCAGRGYTGRPEITYRHCQRSLPDDIEATMKLCQERSVVLVILDSVAMSTAGLGDSGSDQNDSIIKLYSALRLLNTTCLLIDHVSAADLEKKGPRKPYGSIYKINLARMAFDLRSTSKAGLSPLHLAIHNIKRNDGPLLRPVGLLAEFKDEKAVYRSEQISNAELLEHLQGPAKVRLVLQKKPLTAKEIIAQTGEGESNIYKILSRGQADGWLRKEGDEYGLVTKLQEPKGEREPEDDEPDF